MGSENWRQIDSPKTSQNQDASRKTTVPRFESDAMLLLCLELGDDSAGE